MRAGRRSPELQAGASWPTEVRSPLTVDLLPDDGVTAAAAETEEKIANRQETAGRGGRTPRQTAADAELTTI